MDVSTGWETIKDTASPAVVSIHLDVHLVCETQEIAEKRQATFRRAEDQGWATRGHPNMIVRATAPTPPQPAQPASSNSYSTLANLHA
jgi:hypothetical protein